MKKSICMLVAYLVLSVTVYADITIFDSNATISDGDTYDIVVVKGDGTVVDMTGGDVNDVKTMDASTFNMSGGNISYRLMSYDTSVLNLSSSDMSTLYTLGQSKAVISGNASFSSDIQLYDSSIVSVTSSSVVTSEIHVNSLATLNVTAGDIYRVDVVGTANLSGGTVGFITSNEPAVINIIGYDLVAVPYGGTFDCGQATGYWNDDTPFSVSFHSWKVYPHVVLYDGVIPPDCVNPLTSDISGDCMVNFIDFSTMAQDWLECNLDPPELCWE